MCHPASKLIAWGTFVLLLNFLSVTSLAVIAAVTLLIAGFLAKVRLQRVFWRARWLLLTIGVLFGWLTPGEFLPDPWGKLGVTWEGVDLGVRHIALLMAMLASLALMHQHLGTRGMLTGLYTLLAPLPRVGRERGVVRLMLVLEFVEYPSNGGWRSWLEPPAGQLAGQCDFLDLEVFPLRVRDRLVMAACVFLMFGVILL